MKALLSTLTALSEPPFRRLTEAAGLKCTLSKMQFCVCLIVFHHVLGMVHVAHKALQMKDTTLSQASSVMVKTVKCLESMRSGEKWSEVWAETEEFCEVNGIQVTEEDEPVSKCPRQAAAQSGFYPNFTKLLKLALSLPVGTATCERTFSAMRRVRNWMQTTTGQERLSSLCLLHIESDLTKKIKPQQIIDAYDARSKRRILLH
ncbi:hypothetical protein SKAU_G00234820 [Synaphobranchus kaupii]|uniref:HAT C-terminal dimerisation domain-containing protein n=1 Tax=Synaphobranchus kaupii TaxID=118154 RepID=A0A9Q1F6E0_SYNKA|nr:hypothetical protein SKAU_G00234820 [Synaphobranchus kaupii]